MKKVIIIIMAVILLGFVALGGGYVYLQRDTKGIGRQGDDVTFVVEPGANSTIVSRDLQEQGVITNAFWYKLYLKKTGDGPKLQAGTFVLATDLSYNEITKILTKPQDARDTVRVTFPEGSTAIQFARIMQDAGLCTAEEFLEVANNADFSDIEFFKHIVRDENCFMNAEGFLFPETYEFFKDDTVYNMVHKIYSQFDAEITAEMYAEMDKLGMTINEIVTLASLVQEEAGDPINMKPVAGVFANRLKEGSPYPKMGSDVTWYYITDFIRPYYGGEENVPAGMEDNYYTGDEDPNSRIGLPAGPLSCPGIDAIMAALYPEQHDYYFFLTDFTGKYYYAVTYNEHLKNIQTMKQVNASLEQ